MLLIPFQPKMCMSEIGKEVHAKTNMSFDEITKTFRSQLNLAMYNALRKGNTTISLLEGSYRSDSVLQYIYESIGYQYDVVPGTAPDVAGQKEHDPKNDKNQFIKNGQLEVPVDYSKRFMNVSFANKHLLSDLTAKYSTDTYIFINELDIKNVPNVASEDLSAEEFRREVTVHYSIVDKDGKYISKGIATTYFPYSENDPKTIGEKYFSIIAHHILKDYIQALTMAQVSDKQKKQSKSKSILEH